MQSKKIRNQIILNAVFIVLCILVVFPLVLLLSVSLSNEQDIVMNGYKLFPKKIDLSAYEYVFKNGMVILQAYKVTAIFSVLSMILSVLFMSMISYPLTLKDFKPRNTISFYLYFTMLFSGGLVPSYILITQYLHLNDTIWVYILPSLISPWYVFMMRTFMQDIPNEIRESVKIDGGDEFTIFFKIIIPLSKPVLATVALFMFLAKWNDWYTAMLYINNSQLDSLQYLLQRILQNLQLLKTASDMGLSMEVAEVPAETVRMAMAIMVMGPALFVFPFFQKYFVRGITVGSVKG